MKTIITPVLVTVALGLTGSISVATASEAAAKAAVCAGCHGPEGRSAVPDNPILAAQHEGYLMSSLQTYISGERDHGIMKTLAGNLSSEEMAEISAYYAAQTPYQSEATAPGDATSGKAKTAVCAGCHGAEGRSENPMFPNLAGQHAAYLSKALQAYKNGARKNALMAPGMLEPMSDEDIDDIAAYFSSQNPQPAASGDEKEGNQ